MIRLMTISEAASAAGVSPKAIRLWEAKGLIPPVSRTESGYRTFNESDLDLLRFIRQAQRLGLTLREISEIIRLRDEDALPCELVAQMIDAHLTRIEQALDEMHQLHAALSLAQRRAQSSPAGTDSPRCAKSLKRPAHRPHHLPPANVLRRVSSAMTLLVGPM